MIYFDATKAVQSRHRSGLGRTSRCLRSALAALRPGLLIEVSWQSRHGRFVDAVDNKPVTVGAGDTFFTPELFSEAERPGFTAWLDSAVCRKAAFYYDAIPLRFPEITWPKSVVRHPYYMRMLSRFDVVLANSVASAAELRDYWRWMGVLHADPIAVPMGANGQTGSRITSDPGRASLDAIVMLGIVEPRKNQTDLLDAAERLWSEGMKFTVLIAGRVNPHFGRPVVRRMQRLRRHARSLEYHDDLDDPSVAKLFARARFSVHPSIAEGCGLPALESLWAGVPVLCSDIPPFMETADGGGCRMFQAGDSAGLTTAVRELLESDEAITRLTTDACTRPLPTWNDSAAAILSVLS